MDTTPPPAAGIRFDDTALLEERDATAITARAQFLDTERRAHPVSYALGALLAELAVALGGRLTHYRRGRP